MPFGLPEGKATSNHQCMLYAGSPAEHLPGLAAIVKQKLDENWRCLYLNSPRFVAEMRSCLMRAGAPVAEDIQRGAWILSSGQDHLRDGSFDADRLLGALADAVDEATSQGYTGLWATGDMSWEFGPEKNFSKLLEYEYALDRLFERKPALSGVCQYHVDALPNDAVQWGLCTHRSVYINETLSQANPHYCPAGLLTYRGPVVPRHELAEMFARPVERQEAKVAS